MRMKSGRPFLFGCLLILLAMLYSCSSLKFTPEGKIVKDTYSKSYGTDFLSFHPQINAALQDHARTHKGNSFQVARLGSDSVVIRGRYQREGDPDRFFANVTAKPAGPRKTFVEIKISAANPEASSATLERAAGELFRIIESGAGIRAE